MKALVGMLAAGVLTAGDGAASAGEIERSKVDVARGRYTIDAAVRLDAPPDRVLAVVRSPEQLAEVSDTIVEVEVLERESPTRYLRELRMQTCITVFCFDAVMVEWLEDLPGGVIVTELVPESSDFRFGISRWTVRATPEGGTRVTLVTEREPDFWMPPLIGPWLLSRALRHELKVCIERIEALAAVSTGDETESDP